MSVPVARGGYRPPAIPPLMNGDHLDRLEFERRYNAMPEVNKAELIEGVVYMPSPVGHGHHSNPHFNLITWLGMYATATPGVAGGDNGSLRLDMENEPQPDAFMIVLPSHGGKVVIDADDYISGGPELVAEVAASSASIDLNAKRRVYCRNGVLEYVVWRAEDREIDWFLLREGEYHRLPRDAAGIYRSEVLPGLWLDPAVLVNSDLLAVSQVAQQG
jgi:Uma2 family endonuclease